MRRESREARRGTRRSEIKTGWENARNGYMCVRVAQWARGHKHDNRPENWTSFIFYTYYVCTYVHVLTGTRDRHLFFFLDFFLSFHSRARLRSIRVYTRAHG